MKAFENCEFTEAYIVDNQNRLTGKTKVNDLLGSGKKAENTPYPLAINSSSTISEAIVKASNFVGESIPVIDDDKTLLGVVTEADLFSEYLEIQEAISKIEKD